MGHDGIGITLDDSQVLYGLPQSRQAIEREQRLAIVEGNIKHVGTGASADTTTISVGV